MQKKISKHFLKATEYQQPKVKDSLPRSWGKIVDGEQTPVITQGEHLLVIGTLPDLMQRMAAQYARHLRTH